MEQNAKKKVAIPGTKLSLNNTQLIISSGIPSFDEIIGGGLAVGTVTLIEEDTLANYSKLMLQYYVAEGIINGHSTFFGSHELNSSSVITTLPAVIIDTDDLTPKPAGDEDKLKIAWRYQNVPTSQPKSARKFGHFYDLTRFMDTGLMEKADIKCWTPSEKYSSMIYTFVNPEYHELLQGIKDKIDEGGFSLKSNTANRSILRIALQGLGSPLWLPNNFTLQSSSQSRDLDLFLFCLRALVRTALATVMVTIPSKIIEDASVNRCLHSSDIAVRLEAFAGTDLENNKALSDYQGFFYISKLPAINSLAPKDIGPVDFAFKLRRKKFAIEQLHLPPELQDSSEREQDEMPSMGCGSGSKHLLEF